MFHWLLFQIYPLWIAPNVLTFSGFMLLVINFAIMIYYDLDFYASSRDHPEFPPVPSWVWLMCAINNFLSHTLGKTVHVSSHRVVASTYTKSHLLTHLNRKFDFDGFLTIHVQKSVQKCTIDLSNFNFGRGSVVIIS